MGRVAAIVDCYTVEPSGLGVPPYLSAYARQAFSALTRAYPGSDVRYLTIDDVRWCGNDGRPFAPPPLSDQLTYSATVNRGEALRILADADPVVVIAGDAVPSVHLQARNGSPGEINDVLELTRGRRVLVGPLASQLLSGSALSGGGFDAMHTHTVTSSDLLARQRTCRAFWASGRRPGLLRWADRAARVAAGRRDRAIPRLHAPPILFVLQRARQEPTGQFS